MAVAGDSGAGLAPPLLISAATVTFVAGGLSFFCLFPSRKLVAGHAAAAAAAGSSSPQNGEEEDSREEVLQAAQSSGLACSVEALHWCGVLAYGCSGVGAIMVVSTLYAQDVLRKHS